MSLIVCDECGGTVSTKAQSCPHCGYPIQDSSTVCRISGKDYDLREVLEIAQGGDTPMNRVRGNRKIETITGLELAMDLWKEIVSNGRIPKTFETYEERKAAGKLNVPQCPVCKSTKLIKKGISARAIDGAVFGRLSVEARAQFRCEKCGYLF